MENQNVKITELIKKELGLHELTGYPRKVGDTILPVLKVNAPKPIKAIGTSSLNNETSKVAVTLSQKLGSFFLTKLTASYVKDVANLTTDINIQVPSVGFGLYTAIKFAILSATAQQDVISLDFTSNPIELEAGGEISIIVTDGTPKIRVQVGVFGYYENCVGD